MSGASHLSPTPMQAFASQAALVIFAKAPLAGFAKTRLIPALGAAGAASLARRMLQHTVAQALEAALDEVELCVTPDKHEQGWADVSLPAVTRWTNQGCGDLGERLIRAGRRLDATGRLSVFIGTDCPALSAAHIEQAVHSLQAAHACMVPTADGGYALLGFRRFDSLLFERIAWSTNQVAAQTRARCRQLNWQLAELPALHDIDEPEDLQWLPAGFIES